MSDSHNRPVKNVLDFSVKHESQGCIYSDYDFQNIILQYIAKIRIDIQSSDSCFSV